MPGGNVDNSLGGSNALVGLNVKNLWLPGASFLSKGLMVLVTTWMVPECLGAKRTTKGQQFPPLPPLPRTHHRGGYEDHHEWQGRREHYSKGDSMSMHMMPPKAHVIAVVPPVESEPTEDAPVLARPCLRPVPAKRAARTSRFQGPGREGQTKC